MPSTITVRAMPPDEPGAPGRLTEILDLVVDGAVVLGAVWTVVYHTGLWLGATRLQVTTVASGLAVVALWWLVSHRAITTPAEEVSYPVRSASAAAAAALALVAIVLVANRRDTHFWFAAVAALVAAGLSLRRSRPGGAARMRCGAGLVLLFALLAGLNSATQRDWIKDNRYYVDRAFAVRDAAGPIPVGRDTFFSADGRYPSLIPENDLASLEGLVGTASRYLGGHPMSWLSYVVHPLFGFLGVLALWRAARALGAPRPDLVAVLGMIGVYLVSLQSEIGTRAFSSRTGRNGFVVFLVPVLVAYTAELMRRPGAAGALRLVAAGVVSGGLTLSALPAAPVIVLASGAAAWRRPERREWWWLGGTAAAVMAYYGALTIAATLIGRSPVDLEGITVGLTPTGALWREALGRADAYLPLTAIILLGWWVVPTRALRRLLVAAPLGTLVIALSPPSLWLLHQTAVATSIARLGWSLPLGLLVGAVGAGLWERRRLLGPAAAATLLIVVALTVPKVPVPRFGVPGWDVPPLAASAARLVDLARPGMTVAASWSVLAFVPVLTNEVYPVATSRSSVPELAARGVTGFEPEARLEVMSWLIVGPMGREPHRLAAALDAVAIDAVCVKDSVRSRDMGTALRAAGFERAGEDRHCQFWVRAANP
jgi:hypothetical protein